jgi:hypothetical protein
MHYHRNKSMNINGLVRQPSEDFLDFDINKSISVNVEIKKR